MNHRAFPISNKHSRFGIKSICFVLIFRHIQDKYLLLLLCMASKILQCIQVSTILKDILAVDVHIWEVIFLFGQVFSANRDIDIH